MVLNKVFVNKREYNVKKTQVYRKVHHLDPLIFTDVSKALQFLETLLTIYHSTQPNVPEEFSLRQRRSENLKTRDAAKPCY